jgi:hypothetical protein
VDPSTFTNINKLNVSYLVANMADSQNRNKRRKRKRKNQEESNSDHESIVEDSSDFLSHESEDGERRTKSTGKRKNKYRVIF